MAPAWDTDVSFIELNLRVCPNAFLSQPEKVTFTEHLGLLSNLEQLADATHPLTSGRLKCLSQKDCDRVVVLFLGILLSIRKSSVLLPAPEAMPDYQL